MWQYSWILHLKVTTFFKYWLNTLQYYHNTYKYCHKTCEYWAGENTPGQTNLQYLRSSLAILMRCKDCNFGHFRVPELWFLDKIHIWKVKIPRSSCCDTLNLRKIKFGHFRSLKSAIYVISGSLEFCILGKFHIWKCERSP